MVTTHNPRIAEVRVEPDKDYPGAFVVRPVWEADIPLDRATTGGTLVKGRALAERFAAAARAGVVWVDPEVRTDVNGKTYVSSSQTVRGRAANADLRRLGF